MCCMSYKLIFLELNLIDIIKIIFSIIETKIIFDFMLLRVFYVNISETIFHSVSNKFLLH